MRMAPVVGLLVVPGLTSGCRGVRRAGLAVLALGLVLAAAARPAAADTVLRIGTVAPRAAAT